MCNTTLLVKMYNKIVNIAKLLNLMKASKL